MLARVTMGVALFEPIDETGSAGVQLTMINDVAASYYGRVDLYSDPIDDAERGMRSVGLLDLVQLVSLTGREHLQEAVSVPGAIAAGNLVDLTITPVGDGAVTVVFEDVTQRVRTGETG